MMKDTLGSVGVIISTLLIQFYGWTGFDPIASLFIALLIAASVIPLVIDTGKVLMLDLSHQALIVDQALSLVCTLFEIWHRYSWDSLDIIAASDRRVTIIFFSKFLAKG